jgi:hypothetical protein
MSDMPNWGPSHQDTPRYRVEPWKRVVWGLVALASFGAADGGLRHGSVIDNGGGIAIIVILAWIASPRSVQRTTLAPFRRRRRRSVAGRRRLTALRAPRRPVSFEEQLTAIREQGLQHGGGVYLGVGAREPRYARPERAVLVLGPRGRARAAGSSSRHWLRTPARRSRPRPSPTSPERPSRRAPATAECGCLTPPTRTRSTHVASCAGRR